MLSVERGLLGGRRSTPGPRRPAQLPVAAILDPLAVGAVVVLAGLGLANLAALGDQVLMRHQLVVDVGGVALFAVLRSCRTDGLRWLGWGCYAVSMVLLVAVDLSGTTVKGARRWIDLGSFTMQPSELAKLGLVLVLAQVLGSDRPWPRRLATALALAALPIGLVLLHAGDHHVELRDPRLPATVGRRVLHLVRWPGRSGLGRSGGVALLRLTPRPRVTGPPGTDFPRRARRPERPG